MQNRCEVSPGLVTVALHEKRACTFLALASLDTFAILATEPSANVVRWPCNWKDTPVGWFTLGNYIMLEHVAQDSW